MSDNIVVGHSRFDPYGPGTTLEIVGEPLADKFLKKTKKQIVNAADYNPFSNKKRVPRVEKMVESIEVEIPSRRSSHDEETIEVQIGNRIHIVPRWLAKYLD